MSDATSDLAGQMAARLRQADELRQRRVNPYANDFRVTQAIAELPGKALQEEHDVTDLGLLYRQRYLDFIVHPEKAEVFRKRARIISGMRRFFDERGYVECETRMLLSTNGGAAARPFRT